MKSRRCDGYQRSYALASVAAILSWVLLVVAFAGLAILAGCPGETQPVETSASTQPSPTKTLPAGYNFTPQQTSSIIDNVMHIVHTQDAGIECRACHQSPDEFLSHEKALALCKDCHSSQIVALEVWGNHCLSCHQFVKYKERYADSTHILRELCQGCHGEGSSMFWRAFDPSSPHDVTCDNCHHPHKTALVVAGDLCEGCHEDITSKISTENKVHGSCIVCHTPHSALPDSETLCGKCHLATSNILVHNVPEHPRDCLACHSPHFTEAEITGNACLVCHDDTFYGGESNLPYAHRDCESCHFVGNFKYKGDAQCAKCHVMEGEVVARETLPAEHRTCLTCHQPHSWYTAFEHNCERCHDVNKVIEHRLTFHQAACDDCHDPHHTDLMAKSGHCSGCHGEGSFPDFRPDLNDMHLQCANCHSQVAIDSRDFSFAGVEASCLGCHTEADAGAGLGWDEVPSGHKVCQACHAAHTFESDPSAMRCDLCHRDIFRSFPAEAHGNCFNCHQIGHDADFIGQDVSCDQCHADVLELATTKVKEDCLLCHAPHEFTAPETVCVNCHSDVAAQSKITEHVTCEMCHAEHNWRPDSEACRVCHGEPPQLHESHVAIECLDCHGVHSMASDLGTCRACHSALPTDCTSDNCIECHDFAAAK